MAPLLEVENVNRWYQVGGRLRGRRRHVKAMIDVNFAVEEGETVGLIGESGCGKSTLGRTVLGLEPIMSGVVRVAGKVISGLNDRGLRGPRRTMQMVWQNPASAVNPRKRVDKIIREPLDVHDVGTPAERSQRVQELLDLVGLRAEMAQRYPHELSGGQLQRVVIARALALEPKLLVCDEPTSALDISVRAQIVNLLVDIRERLGLSMLYISHDLRTVGVVSDRVLIMYLGRIVEEAPASALEADELLHPYARALSAAAPSLDPGVRRGRPPAMGEVPDAMELPSGCSYHPRCLLAKEICGRVSPDLADVRPGRRVACHAVAGSGHAEWVSENKPPEVSPAPVVQVDGIGT